MKTYFVERDYTTTYRWHIGADSEDEALAHLAESDWPRREHLVRYECWDHDTFVEEIT